MKVLLLFLLLTTQSFVFAQSGSAGNPFTSLGNAHYVPSSGTYYFNVGGNSFSTYVEAGNGWILIASGNAATSETSYSYTTSLTLQSDGILPAAIYNSSSLVTGVRMNATSGPSTPFDVQSVNATVLDNLKNNRTLSSGTNAANWTGTGTARLQRSCTSNNSSLQTHIYHACGNNSNMHWQVGQNTAHERVNLSSTSKNNLNLWVKADPVTAFPVEWTAFSAVPLGETVVLSWQTASEANNDFFLVERSINGQGWDPLEKIDGSGDSSRPVAYTATDFKPNPGTSYYRIRQTDLDGQISYSPSKAVWMGASETVPVHVFPNPTDGLITLETGSTGWPSFKLCSSLGEELTDRVKIRKSSENQCELDLSALPSGIYQIWTISGVGRIVKQEAR